MIVCDDCSDDGSDAFLEDYSREKGFYKRHFKKVLEGGKALVNENADMVKQRLGNEVFIEEIKSEDIVLRKIP